MKAMILAGGFGTRLAEETDIKPKPMVEIGGRPILWHIMEHYAKHGIKDFIICLGYKADYIKKFFIDYSSTMSDFTVDLSDPDQKIQVHNRKVEDWKITLVDTGVKTMTGGRIKRALRFIEPKSNFCLTYGDGLSNVDLTNLVKYHNDHGKLATVTAVTPPGRFGVLDIGKDQHVRGFREKIVSDQYRINGGFFVLSYDVINYIEDDTVVWEQKPMVDLASDNQLVAWSHNGFWYPMDTLRDKMYLEELWKSGNPPWKKR